MKRQGRAGLDTRALDQSLVAGQGDRLLLGTPRPRLEPEVKLRSS